MSGFCVDSTCVFNAFIFVDVLEKCVYTCTGSDGWLKLHFYMRLSMDEMDMCVYDDGWSSIQIMFCNTCVLCVLVEGF